MSGLVAAITGKTGFSPAPVTHLLDAELEAMFGRYPPLTTPAGNDLGFRNDDDLTLLVDRSLARCD